MVNPTVPVKNINRFIIEVDTTSPVSPIVLPFKNMAGVIVTVVDSAANASVNNIIVTPPAGTINGNTQDVIAVDGGSRDYWLDGANWKIVGNFAGAAGESSVPRQLQIVATRGVIPNSIRQGTAGGRADLRVENRQLHYFGNQPVSQLCLAMTGFYLKNDATGEHLFTNDFTWESAIEITSPANYFTEYAVGTQFPTVQSTNQGIPLMITAPTLGVDIAAGGSAYVRMAESVASASQFLPSSSQSAASTDTGSISPSTASQVQATGAMTSPTGGTSFSGCQPALVLGIPQAPMACMIILGDSIADGTGDTVDAYGNLGFAARGLFSVNGYPVPWGKNTVGSDKLSQNTLATGWRKRSTWPYATHLICALGTNDIAAAATLASVQSLVQAIWQAAKRTIGPYGKPLQVAQSLLMPRTTSTDSWATAAGQTPVAGFAVGGVRDQFNTWVKAQVGQGLLDAYIDVNQYVEDRTTPGVWITNGTANYPTTDGVHPSSAVHILAAQAVNTYALTIVP